MKRLCGALASVAIVFLYTLTPGAEEIKSYFLVEGYYPSSAPPSYENLYLAYTFHWAPASNVALHFSLRKGNGESGYYPAGYITEAEGGLYEKGTYYLAVRDLQPVSKAIVGNYVPQFGQGLLFGSLYPPSLSNFYFDLPRYRDGLYPASSPSKAGVLEGVAMELDLGAVRVRPFFSWNSFDCSAGESDYYRYDDNDEDRIPNDEDEDDFDGIPDGLPRRYSSKTELFRSVRGEPSYVSENARARRNNLAEYVTGLNVSGGSERLKANGTVAYTRYDRLVDPYYNFERGEGDKTGNSFRGVDYLSTSLAFKSYGEVEFFGEAAGSFYTQRSYYPEFDGDFSSALGVSGGLRRKGQKAGFVAWGAYLPANLVNPHGQELPDGVNNVACGLVGVHRGRGFDGWVYAHRELYEEDASGDLESGVSLNYDLERPVGGGAVFEIQQGLDILDNYFYAPGRESWTLDTEVSTTRPLSKTWTVIVSLDSSLGGPVGEEVQAGAGLSAEVVGRRKGSSAVFYLMGYATDDSGFAYLYPYERPFYTWSSFPGALTGTGLFGYLYGVKALKGGLVFGGKVRYRYDLKVPDAMAATFYLICETGF